MSRDASTCPAAPGTWSRTLTAGRPLAVSPLRERAPWRRTCGRGSCPNRCHATSSRRQRMPMTSFQSPMCVAAFQRAPPHTSMATEAAVAAPLRNARRIVPQQLLCCPNAAATGFLPGGQDNPRVALSSEPGPRQAGGSHAARVPCRQWLTGVPSPALRARRLPQNWCGPRACPSRPTRVPASPQGEPRRSESANIVCRLCVIINWQLNGKGGYHLLILIT